MDSVRTGILLLIFGYTGALSAFANPEANHELDYAAVVCEINRTETPFGREALDDALKNPCSTQQALTARKQVLHLLIDDTAAFDTYHELIGSLKDNPLANYWKDEDPLHQQAEDLYFNLELNGRNLSKINDYLNSSKMALGASNFIETLRSVIDFQLTLIIPAVASEFLSAGLHERSGSLWQGIVDSFVSPLRQHYPFLHYFKDETAHYMMGDGFKLSGGDMHQFTHRWLNASLPTQAIACTPYLATALVIAYIATSDYLIYRKASYNISALSKTFATTVELQKTLLKVRQFFIICQQLDSFAQQHPECAELAAFKTINSFLHDDSRSLGLQQLIPLLTGTELLQQNILLQPTGGILIAHKLLLECKDELKPLIQAVGHCDVLLSTVKLYQEKQYCLPTFTTQETQIQFTHFWHPCLNSQTAVRNSITLGGTQPRNLLITGPNGGGKSTSMAAICWAVLLSHALGITPAEQATLSIFSGIYTYLAPQADLRRGISTFMAEKTRIDSIIKQVSKLNSSYRYFFIIDEPCRGTLERVAEKVVLNFAHILGDSPHCISLMATHLEKPIELEQQTGKFINYQMELLDDGDHFKRTFKLLPGAAWWWFIDEDKRMRFIEQV